MAARAQYIPSNGKVAMVIGNRRVLASFDDAAELLAELQVIFHERMIHEDKEADDE